MKIRPAGFSGQHNELADDLGKIRLSDLIGNNENESGLTRLLLVIGTVSYFHSD